MLEHYARITLQRELMDALWRAQAGKMGLRPDAPLWIVQGAVAIHEMTPPLVDLMTSVADELVAFGQSLMSAFAGGFRRRSALPPAHGQRCHTNRTRSR